MTNGVSGIQVNGTKARTVGGGPVNRKWTWLGPGGHVFVVV
jgi:hypothetical protein